jgi:PAS domain S-box-containing protein
MVETIYTHAGILATLLLMLYVGYLRTDWLFTSAAVVFGSMGVHAFGIGAGSPRTLVILSVMAAVFAGALLRRNRGAAAVAFAIWMILTPALTQAVQGGISPSARPGGAGSDSGISKTGFICLLGLATLVVGTRRRAALAGEMRQAWDINRRLWDGASDGIVLVDRHSRIVEWNPAMERLTGVTRRNVAGTVLTECPGFENSPNHKESLRLANQGVEIASDAISAGGAAVSSPFRAYYSPVLGQHGERAGVLAIVTSNPAQDTLAALPACSRIDPFTA